MPELSDLRKEFLLTRLTREQLAADGIEQFEQWMQDAVGQLHDEATVMHLSTVDANGFPHSRVVLLKGIHDGELLFFTNYRSAKGQELEANPHVAVCFYWHALERQVRIEGDVHECSSEVSDAYFQSRPLESRIGAWASPQSEVVDDGVVQQYFQLYQQQFADGNVPRPLHWGGYAIRPRRIEFWQGGANRLHDRFVYSLNGKGWEIDRLAP